MPISAVARVLSAYAVGVWGAASVFGAGWGRTGDGFAVLFSRLGALSPLFRDGTGRLRLRVPGSGLAAVDVRPGTLGVVLVVLGGTTFHGLTRTQWWDRTVGGHRAWALAPVRTVGLVLPIAPVSVPSPVATRALRLLPAATTHLP